MDRFRAFLLVLVCFAFAACKPLSSETAADVRVVNAEPRCKKLGVVEGVGGNAEHARKDALVQAAERGATHVLLESAHPDLEDGMTMVVTGEIYGCPSSDEALPPDGYQ